MAVDVTIITTVITVVGTLLGTITAALIAAYFQHCRRPKKEGSEGRLPTVQVPPPVPTIVPTQQVDGNGSSRTKGVSPTVQAPPPGPTTVPPEQADGQPAPAPSTKSVPLVPVKKQQAPSQPSQSASASTAEPACDRSADVPSSERPPAIPKKTVADGRRYFLPVRKLKFDGGDVGNRWKVSRDARLGDVARLTETWNLKIDGGVDAKDLSQDTTYVAYLVYKLPDDSVGFDKRIQLTIGRQGSSSSSQREVCLEAPPLGGFGPREREDGWNEVVVGEIHNVDGSGKWEVSVKAAGGERRRGVKVGGIEFRPLDR